MPRLSWTQGGVAWTKS